MGHTSQTFDKLIDAAQFFFVFRSYRCICHCIQRATFLMYQLNKPTHIHSGPSERFTAECWMLMWLFSFRSFFGHIHKIYFHSTIYTRTSQKLHPFDILFTLPACSQQSTILVNWFYFFCLSMLLSLFSSLTLVTNKMRRDHNDKKEPYIHTYSLSPFYVHGKRRMMVHNLISQ